MRACTRGLRFVTGSREADNRTEKHDTSHQYRTNIGRSEKYVYDGLNRLREARAGRSTMVPGTQNSGQTFTPVNGSTNWVLDSVGNWLATRKDLAGTPASTPVYTDNGDTKDARTHNSANATNQIDDSTVTTVGGGSVPATPFGYDKSGNLIAKGPAGGSGSADVRYTYDAWNRLVKVQKYDSSAATYRTVNEFAYNGLHWRVRVKECSVLNVRPDSPMSSSVVLDRDRLIYFDPSWRAVAERVDVDADGGFGEESADTIWGLTYIDEAIVSRRIGGGSDIGKGDPLYHLYDAQFSVVARMRDEGGVLPRMVERIRYSVYGEPTVFPYSFADCADSAGNDGPDGYITTRDNTRYNHATTGWYTSGDIRADIADDAGVVPMDFLGTGNSGVTAADATAFSTEYGANAGLFPVEGAASLVPAFWSSGGATGPTGPTDSPVSDVGYCGYAWNPGSGQYAVRFRNYDPALGRWLQRDPAGYVDGVSLQEYCAARSTNSIDPFGLDFIPASQPKQDPVFSFPPANPISITEPTNTPSPGASPSPGATPIAILPKYDPRNDPQKGCGITVRRINPHDSGDGKEYGHDWIEINDPERRGIEGIGFYPLPDEYGGTLLVPGKLVSITPKLAKNNCACVKGNDPYTGRKPDIVYEVFPRREEVRITGDQGPLVLHREYRFMGRRMSVAHCDQVRNCIRKSRAPADYSPDGDPKNRGKYGGLSHNCREGADQILHECGLTRWNSWKWKLGDDERQRHPTDPPWSSR